MKIETIAAILTAHSVPHYIKSGRIYADTMEAFAAPFAAVEDITDYTRPQLYAWLGY